jgi:hypothetical protein
MPIVSSITLNSIQSTLLRSLLEASYTRIGESERVYSKPFWQQLAQLQSQWDVNLRTTNGLELKQQMIQ